jgi:peptide/nickel transport system permease protein
MLAFILRRLAQSFLVMLVVAFFAFTMFNYVGNPIDAMVGQDVSLQERAELAHRLGLDEPAPIRFVKFVARFVQGNFGISYRMQDPVGKLILERLPASLELSFVAALFALLIGVPMGVYAGLYPQRWSSRLLLGISLVGVSLPTFLVGILLIVCFSVLIPLLPSFGRGDTVEIGWWATGFLTVSGLKALIMPAITLGLFQMTLIMRLVRAEMLEVIRTDYIKFARARGLSNRAVHFGHALKNTLVPVITITGLQLGQLIAFSVITETVFNWPGMGLLFIQSLQSADIPVMATFLVLIAAFIVVINLAADLLYFAVDPRLRSDVAVKA